MDPAHYRLAEAGLWWDSFEEEPEFEVMEYEFDDLTLHEGDRTHCSDINTLTLASFQKVHSVSS